MKARAFAERERIAARAVNGALEDPKLALALIREVDPPQEVTVSVGMPVSLEDVDRLSLSQHQALQEQLRIHPTPAAFDAPEEE